MNTAVVNEIVIYYPEGRISNEKKDALEFFLVQLVNDHANCDLIINMEDVPSISSGCIEVLDYISQSLKAVGRNLSICRPRDLVKRILALLRDRDFISVYETEDEAIAALMPEIVDAIN
jgi:anti-anti-sigma factor